MRNCFPMEIMFFVESVQFEIYQNLSKLKGIEVEGLRLVGLQGCSQEKRGSKVSGVKVVGV